MIRLVLVIPRLQPNFNSAKVYQSADKCMVPEISWSCHLLFGEGIIQQFLSKLGITFLSIFHSITIQFGAVLHQKKNALGGQCASL